MALDLLDSEDTDNFNKTLDESNIFSHDSETITNFTLDGRNVSFFFLEIRNKIFPI